LNKKLESENPENNNNNIVLRKFFGNCLVIALFKLKLFIRNIPMDNRFDYV